MCLICRQNPCHPSCPYYEEVYTCNYCLSDIKGDEVCLMGGKYYCHYCADEYRKQIEDEIAYCESEKAARLADLRFMEGFVEANAGDDKTIADFNRYIAKIKKEIEINKE